MTTTTFPKITVPEFDVMNTVTNGKLVGQVQMVAQLDCLVLWTGWALPVWIAKNTLAHLAWPHFTDNL